MHSRRRAHSRPINPAHLGLGVSINGNGSSAHSTTAYQIHQPAQLQENGSSTLGSLGLGLLNTGHMGGPMMSLPSPISSPEDERRGSKMLKIGRERGIRGMLHRYFGWNTVEDDLSTSTSTRRRSTSASTTVSRVSSVSSISTTKDSPPLQQHQREKSPSSHRARRYWTSLSTRNKSSIKAALIFIISLYLFWRIVSSFNSSSPTAKVTRRVKPSLRGIPQSQQRSSSSSRIGSSGGGAGSQALDDDDDVSNDDDHEFQPSGWLRTSLKGAKHPIFDLVFNAEGRWNATLADLPKSLSEATTSYLSSHNNMPPPASFSSLVSTLLPPIPRAAGGSYSPPSKDSQPWPLTLLLPTANEVTRIHHYLSLSPREARNRTITLLDGVDNEDNGLCEIQFGAKVKDKDASKNTNGVRVVCKDSSDEDLAQQARAIEKRLVSVGAGKLLGGAEGRVVLDLVGESPQFIPNSWRATAKSHVKAGTFKDDPVSYSDTMSWSAACPVGSKLQRFLTATSLQQPPAPTGIIAPSFLHALPNALSACTYPDLMNHHPLLASTKWNGTEVDQSPVLRLAGKRFEGVGGEILSLGLGAEEDSSEEEVFWEKDVPWEDKVGNRVFYRGPVSNLPSPSLAMSSTSYRLNLLPQTPLPETFPHTLTVSSNRNIQEFQFLPGKPGKDVWDRWNFVNAAFEDAGSGDEIDCVGEEMECEELRLKLRVDLSTHAWRRKKFIFLLSPNPPRQAFLSGSLVFWVGAEVGPWHNIAVPWVHYVPVAPDFSDLPSSVLFFRSRDDYAKRIAGHGQRLAKEVLTPKGEALGLVGVLGEWSRVWDGQRSSAKA